MTVLADSQDYSFSELRDIAVRMSRSFPWNSVEMCAAADGKSPQSPAIGGTLSPTRVDVSSPTHDTCVSARNLAGVSDMIGNPGSFPFSGG